MPTWRGIPQVKAAKHVSNRKTRNRGPSRRLSGRVSSFLGLIDGVIGRRARRNLGKIPDRKSWALGIAVATVALAALLVTPAIATAAAPATAFNTPCGPLCSATGP